MRFMTTDLGFMQANFERFLILYPLRMHGNTRYARKSMKATKNAFDLTNVDGRPGLLGFTNTPSAC